MFPKRGVPQNGWFIVENPIKMDDLGENPVFLVQHPPRLLDYMTIIVSTCNEAMKSAFSLQATHLTPSNFTWENPTQPATLRWWCHQTGTKNEGILT